MTVRRSYRLIKKILFCAFFLLFVPVAYAEAPIEQVLDIPSQIAVSALKWHINGFHLKKVLECESGLNPSAIGDHGTSLGIAQIHLPAHPSITKEQALNPAWAIDWAASEFSKGRQWEWTCARLLGFY